MAVYKRTYKAYRGAMTPAWSRFTVLSRYGLSTLFDSRPFAAYVVLCLFPFLIGVGFIYLVHNPAVQALLNWKVGESPLVDNQWFFVFLAIEAWMGLMLTAWVAPGMISRDFANHSIQLYLSRPLSRAEYLFGKVSVLGALLSCTTWVPALILFLLQAELEGHGWGWTNLWLVGSIMVASLLGIAVISLLAMALGVWVKWRIAATALMLGTFFVLPGFASIFNAIMRTHWGDAINLPFVLRSVWMDLFRMPRGSFTFRGIDPLPHWAPWLSLLSLCAICIWLLHSRLKAREVERA